MSQGASAKEAESETFECDLNAVIHNVLEDSLSNIIHDVVLQVHRTEKQLRMSSAATQISIAAQNNLQSPYPSETPTKASNTLQASQAGRSGKYDTSYATYNDGVITLKGNPLETTPQIYCSQCRLPRLLFPLTGAGAQMPEDVNAQYCTRHPYVSKPGHDIYGNPFPSDQAKSKKERELQKRQDKDSTPASQNSDPNGLNQEEQLQNGISKLIPTGKGANYIPWHTCPRCKRSLLITRFAQHLEKCLGISGRQSSRNAMAKLTGNNGSIAGTPMGSRPGTPGPGGDNKGSKRERDEDDGDELDDVPLKKMKKRPYIKKADRERMAAQNSQEAANQGDEREAKKEKPEKREAGDNPKIFLKMRPGSAGSPTKGDTPAKRPPSGGGDRLKPPPSVKRERERDRDGDEATPKKKMKVAAASDGGTTPARKDA